MVVEIHVVAFQKVLDLRDPSGDFSNEVPIVGFLAQGILGMKDVAQSPVDRYELAFAQKSFFPILWFLAWGASLKLYGPWVEVGMNALQFPELPAYVLGTLQLLLRPLPDIGSRNVAACWVGPYQVQAIFTDPTGRDIYTWNIDFTVTGYDGQTHW